MKHSRFNPRVRLGLLVAVLGLSFGEGLSTASAGRIVVAHDDLVLADGAFHDPSDPGVFARNVAAWFTGGRAGRFLAYSDNQGLTGALLAGAMTSAGHTWVVSTSEPLTLSNLLTFDGIFLCGVPVTDNALLGEYVNAGGNVYLAGVGVVNDDMGQWNSFLEEFGLAFSSITTPDADFTIASAERIFAGVDHLYGVNGTSIIDLQPTNRANRVLITDAGLGLFAIWDAAPLATSFDALAEISSFQGGTSGAWFYEEFDGEAFTDLVFRPAGNSFSGSQPTWAAANSVLPLIFKDSATTDGLVFHPGVPGGQQPARHDVALRWEAYVSGFYSIRGFVRGDSRFGIGGDGIQFGIYRQQDMLLNTDIAFNDKTNHPVTLRHVYINAGESLSFRVFDKGNNEHDVGVFNFRISSEQPGLRIRVSQVELSWDAASNTTYSVEYRPAFGSSGWLPLGTNCFSGDGSVISVYDLVPADEAQRFYRLVTNCVPQP